MNLYHLNYFLTLANYEHYTRAAQHLQITQPTLSQAIKSLENELGVDLFEKQGRNVVLTDYGHQFRKDVQQSIDILNTSVENLKHQSLGSGHIKIALLRQISRIMVPKTVRAFLDTYPDRQISFEFDNVTGMSIDMIKNLVNRKADVAFCSKMDDFNELIEYIPFAKQDLIVAVSKDHPLADKDAIYLKETLNYPHIKFTQTSGLYPIIHNLYTQYQLNPEFVYTVGEDETAAGLVEQNFGISIMHDIKILDQMAIKKLQIKNKIEPRYYYLAYLKDVYQPPVLELFIDFVKNNNFIR